MRLSILTATLACLAMATAAHASRITSIAPQLGFPVPGRDVGSDQLGVSVGVALHDMESPHVGVGLDVVYHYWPASPGYKAAFNRYLSNTYLEELDSPTYAFQAIQVTPHVRVLARSTKTWSPWLQAGAGFYLVRHDLGKPTWTGNVTVTGPGPDEVTVTPGWNLALGCDSRSGPRASVGLDITMHTLWAESSPGLLGGSAKIPAFVAISAGMHVLYGW
jgi:hypothetical protein